MAPILSLPVLEISLIRHQAAESAGRVDQAVTPRHRHLGRSQQQRARSAAASPATDRRVDGADEPVAAPERQHAVRRGQPRPERCRRSRPRARAARGAASAPSGTAPASSPGRRSRPRPTARPRRPAPAATTAVEPVGPEAVRRAPPDHGSGTRQPSRPLDGSAGLDALRVHQELDRDVQHLRQPELLALVHVRRPGQRQHQQRRGAGPAPARRRRRRSGSRAASCHGSTTPRSTARRPSRPWPASGRRRSARTRPRTAGPGSRS